MPEILKPTGRSGGTRHQAVRFVVAGAFVAAVQIGAGLGLSRGLGIDIQVAIPVAYVIAVATHFSLQRWFVFAGTDFARSLGGQLGRYLPMTTSQYAFTALSTGLLPEPLGVSEDAVFVVASLVAAVGAFIFMRVFVFHARRTDPGVS